MDYTSLYQEKLCSADDAVSDIRNGAWIDYGFCTGTANVLDAALAKRMPSLEDIKIRGAILMKVPEIFKIDHPEQHFCWNSWHMSGIERKAMAAGISYYSPIRFSELPKYYRENVEDIDIAMFQVAPMDKFGYFSFGPNATYLADMCSRAKKIVVEVNENMPRVWGGFSDGIHISNVNCIVEGNNDPIGEMGGSGPATEVDQKVAELIVNEIPDGACLQLGIGGMPNAVGSLIAKSDLKHLGIHTEMYVDAFVDIAQAGKIDGLYKNIDKGRQVFAFGAGTKKLYDYVDDNPECMSVPVDYVNDISNIASIDNFISINNTVDIDLYGQISAESSGTKHISGAGGQLDFVMGAYLSKGGKSFICCSSTFKNKQGELVSRILPTLKPGSVVTDTRANTNFVVTEYGMVNLKGMSTWQRAEALISIAHPQFRQQLIDEAEKMNIWRKANYRLSY